MGDSSVFPFADLPEEYFPFRIEFYDVATDRMFLTIEVSGPGVIEVPPCSDYGVEKAYTKVHWPDGDVSVSYPD